MRAIMILLVLAVAPGLAENAGHSLPLFFFANTGQTDSSIHFVAEMPEMRAGFRRDSAVFQVHGFETEVHYAGASRDVKISGSKILGGKANFLIGAEWRTDVPTYQQILYRGLYPGIDMTYGGIASRIKSEFIVAPGADPKQIRLEYMRDRVWIDINGDLVVHTGGGGEFREEAPEIYQELGGRRVHVDGRYRLFDPRTVGFEIDSYDISKALVIDPTISYGTYLGGSGMGNVTGLAVDGGANLYVTGWTEALNFPIAGAYQAANTGGVDAFVVKLNSAGTAIVYATYLGGQGDDRAAGIAVDSSGNAYVTGSTASTNFPLVSPIRTALGGGRDAFAVKLNSAGNALIYSTYLGGSNNDLGTGIVVDAAGNAYITGDTLSADFPVASAVQATFGGQTDAFVTKLSPSGAIVFSTFLGGSGVEHAGGIAIDSGPNIFVAGGTSSTNFPVVAALQPANGGNQDVFVTKIKATGAAIVYSTYLGGTGGSLSAPEQANGIVADASGNAYITGVTNSTNFPVTSGAFQTGYKGATDAFVAKISPGGNALLYSTYLGGSSFDQANGIAVDSSGSAYVAGYTSSGNFPSTNGVQAGFKGLYDAFVAKLNTAGNGLTFSTYYGGTNEGGHTRIVDSTTWHLDHPLRRCLRCHRSHWHRTTGSSGRAQAAETAIAADSDAAGTTIASGALRSPDSQ